MKTKLIIILTALGILVGVAGPAMARGPRGHGHSHVEVGFRAPVLRVGIDLGHSHRYDRYDRRDRFDSYLYRRGVALESEGQQLVAEGRDLEWRAQRWGNWYQARQGERLQRRGYQLIREGQALQERARW